jgi:RND superfamily putative drug exporter
VTAQPDFRPNTGLLARAFARLVVLLSWLIVPGWVAAAAAAYLSLPGIGGLESAPLSGLVPGDSPAMRAQLRSQDLFRVPVRSGLVVVARKEKGFSLREQEKIVFFAERATRARGSIALPVVNTLGLVPGSRERDTTAVTYLFLPQGSLLELVAGGEDYARRLGAVLPGAFTGLTGALAARDAESDAINAALPWVELGTVLLVFFVLAFSFRSLGAPLIALFAAGIAFVISERVVTWVADRFDLSVPREVEPLMLVLLLGVVTDYAVFFLVGTRQRLAGGAKRTQAARWTAAQYTPIITTAALIVAIGAATILVGSLDFFRVFGPGLAVAVLIGLAVAITLVPALLAIFGRATFWPGGLAAAGVDAESDRPDVRTRITGLVRHRPVAFVAVLVSVAALVAAASGLALTRLALAPIRGLDGDAGPARAYHQAARGFAPGIVAPTEVILEAPGIAGRTRALAEVRRRLAKQPGVAGVVGPGVLPPIREVSSLFRSRSGNAVRYFVLLDDDPYSAHAVSLVKGLNARLPRLLERAGLGGARPSIAGDTAAARDAVGATHRDLLRIGVAVVIVNLILLALFLRALIAPVYLVLASALALLAAVGLSTLFFNVLLGYPDLTYYVPLAAGVLLVSLGADYNLFVVGRIWQEARRLPLAEAIGVAAPRASRAVTIAGVTLALSFSLLAIVPLAAFREFAFIMAVGALLDTFLVRTFLVPGLISLVGGISWWPGVPRETRSAARP